jgi:hypothetical protein
VRAQALAARLAPAALPAATAVTGFAFIAVNTLRVRDWAVMTDELLYSKLATAIAGTGSPVPTIHGDYYGALAQVYPLVLAPLYAVFDAPTAFRVAHGLNAALMASAAIPTYLLARTVVPPVASAAAALAAVVTPWTVLAGFVMTESVAYPAFAWAIVAMHAALVRPSRRRDALVLVALVVAFFARTQFVALAVVLPAAVVAHEAGLAAVTGAGLRGSLATSFRRAVSRHGVLAGAYAVTALGVAVLAAARVIDSLLGTYAVTATEGSLLPAGVWTSAVAHLVAVAVGLGVLPVLVAAAWAVTTVVRSANPAARSLAVLVLLVVPALSIQVASYDLRFGETDLVRDRYLFYVVPLIVVAAAAALLERRPSWVALAAAGGLFAVAVWSYDFPVVEPFTVDSPVALINERIVDLAGDGSARLFTATTAVLLVVGLVAARSFVRRGPLAVTVLAAVVVFGAAAGQDAFARVLDSVGPSGRVVSAGAGPRADWIDDAVPAGAGVAMIPFPVAGGWETSAVRWWDVEFWNASVVETLVDGRRAFSYTPFPAASFSVDWVGGRVRTEADEAFVVVGSGDTRFRLAGPRRAARGGLELIAAERPYRVEWATRGADPDGWLRPGRPAIIRVFARPGARDELAAFDVVLRAPGAATATYVVAGVGDTRASTLQPAGSALEHVELCVPAGSRAELSLAADRAARIPEVARGPAPRGKRDVGVRIEAIVLARGGDCTA